MEKHYEIYEDLVRAYGNININKLNKIMNKELEYDIKIDKTLRVELDRNLQILKKQSPSRERSLAITKLQEAIMWLGMDLKRLNQPNPYPDSYDPSNNKIAPTADGMKM